jgi:hypothetical protein
MIMMTPPEAHIRLQTAMTTSPNFVSKYDLKMRPPCNYRSLGYVDDLNNTKINAIAAPDNNTTVTKSATGTISEEPATIIVLYKHLSVME